MDVKANGGYVIAPPSNHVKGVYRWADGHKPNEIGIAEIPPWLLKLLPQKSEPPKQNHTFTIVEAAARFFLERAQAYVARADAASEGNRNATAFRLAGNVAALSDNGNRLSEGEIIGLLTTWNQRNRPPLSDLEVCRCVASALKNGQPRPPKESNGRGCSPVVQASSEPIAAEPYKPFPVSILPAAVGNFVDAASCAIGCDASFVALPLLGCLARAIGNKRVIRLKRTWTEPAIIWAQSSVNPARLKHRRYKRRLRFCIVSKPKRSQRFKRRWPATIKTLHYTSGTIRRGSEAKVLSRPHGNRKSPRANAMSPATPPSRRWR